MAALSGIVLTVLAAFYVHSMLSGVAQARLADEADARSRHVQQRLDRIAATLGAEGDFLTANPAPAEFDRQVALLIDLRPEIRAVSWMGPGGRVLRTGPTGAEIAPADVAGLLHASTAAGAPPAGGAITVRLSADGANLLLAWSTSGGASNGETALVARIDLRDLLTLRMEGQADPALWTRLSLRSRGGEAAFVQTGHTAAATSEFSRALSIGDGVWWLDMTGDLVAGLARQSWEVEAVLVFGFALTFGISVVLMVSRRRAHDRIVLMDSLEQANAVLHASERKYRDIYENAVEGMFTITVGGAILSANPALVRMLGYASEEDLATALTDAWAQLFVDPRPRVDFPQGVVDRGAIQDFVAEIRRKDGSALWASLSARVLRDGAGRAYGIQGTADDITDRRRAEVALRLAKEQSEFASRSKTEFLANMSHELRTPLNAIIGFSEIIGSQSLGAIGNPAYAEYAKDIHDSGRMLLDLINDILDLSKIEAGKRELNEHSVDLPRVFASCLRVVKERAIRGGIHLQTDYADFLPRLRADEVALKQLLSNLLANAVKFTLKGGTVTLGARVDGDGRLVITVADTGIGMRAEDIGRALEPFRQIENPLTRTAGGAGLGLPLVRALVELHDGKLEIESEPGTGTIARVIMPADRVWPDIGLVAAAN
ncbi:PAS domain-containing sensor histidine kinase [Nitrospirillum sp. BR 11163]|uniref:PAS domain-containing sensor histidine kinase n=1 Tax=Nitrospirillum sp. BR 11163 TaxID=3104323 RepID=UPI002AFFF713|nr:PAS domain-containing sensor histidine kinase [Nitrospirillum sp. BR 11163]MEA1677514.1 PAS domain-containing sensor histidine kinase [Nitrospirillum sp. BR 11163]